MGNSVKFADTWSKVNYYLKMILSIVHYLIMLRMYVSFLNADESGYKYSLYGIVLGFLVYIIRWRSYRYTDRRFKSTLLIIAYLVIYCLTLIIFFHRDTKNIVPYIFCLTGLILLGFLLRHARQEREEEDERPSLIYYLGTLWLVLTLYIPDMSFLFALSSALLGLWSTERMKTRVTEGGEAYTLGRAPSGDIIVFIAFMFISPLIWTSSVFSQRLLIHPSITALYFLTSYFFTVEYTLFASTSCGLIKFQNEGG